MYRYAILGNHFHGIKKGFFEDQKTNQKRTLQKKYINKKVKYNIEAQ